MNPIILPSNRPADRFYRGGRRITDFRGEHPAGEREPEDWVASVTTVADEDLTGLTVLPDGRLLRDAIADEPAAWLGAAHVARFGVDAMLLVKLLDAGERLPVHAHPHRSFAGQHLSRAHGKAEAWVILEGGEVYLGLQRDLTTCDLDDLLRRQDSVAFLDSLHRIDVSRGDVVYVPPGVLHAIGAGVFLAELQEPEDLSILVEWEGFALDGASDGHLGLGFDVALGAVERRARSAADIATLVLRAAASGPLLPSEADEYFRLDRIVVDDGAAATIEAGFSVLIVLEGVLELVGGGGAIGASGGQTIVVPDAVGPLTVRGAGELLVCRPPASGATLGE
ncbi:class I mannose-6-phosphate isomerase [Labedella endophytica]|uniref:Carbohydrate kinase n=1 Tax=Labedella endophytica TaxID=1523160 RepID=A0A3S0XAT1_9MICO|nr:class I mannose-6-phosphate isomerase [Labedella endophytica]RUR00955.1 carbohydrate kinase [Labedella endophytica]